MNKKIILSLLLAVLVLVSISAVSAADINVKGTTFDDVQKAIDTAQAGDVIYLNNGTYKVNETPVIIKTDDLTIYGGSNAHDGKYSTLDGLNKLQIMQISAKNIKIVGVNFVNGYSYESGALYIKSGSSLTIENSLFYHNGYDYENDGYAQIAGAIYAIDSDLTLINAEFNNNRAIHAGGAIYADNSVLNVINSNFENNQLADRGDIVLMDLDRIDENLNMENMKILRENVAGGAIYATGSLTLTDSKFISNRATFGGAISYAPSNIRDKFEGFLIVEGCSFIGNYADFGGAIYAPFGDLTITDSEFIQNRGNGAAIYHSFEYVLKSVGYSSSDINGILNSKNHLEIDNSIFTNNGIAIPVPTENKVLTASLQANELGLLFGNYGAVVTSYSINVDKSKFTENRANTYGGAITIVDLFADKSSNPISAIFAPTYTIDAVITNSEFNSNIASTGGAIAFAYLDDMMSLPSDKLYIYNSKFDGNTILNINSNLLVGGAVFSMTTTVVDESTFKNNAINSSTQSGGFKSVFKTQGASSYSSYYGSGGALGVLGDLTLTNSYFDTNKALKGGAVAVLGNLFVEDCTFANNNGSFIKTSSDIEEPSRAAEAAQAKANYDVLEKDYDKIGYENIPEDSLYSTLRDLDTFAGAILVIGSANINDCIFNDNYAYSGGAISIFGSLNLTNCNFTDNIAQLTGGAISIFSPEELMGSLYGVKTQINIVSCDFTGNAAIETKEAYSRGGAIYVFDSYLIDSDNLFNVIDSRFEANSAYEGGAIYYSARGYSNLNIDFCEFVENVASGYGGALALFVNDVVSNNSVDISNSIFNGNKAAYGGAIAFNHNNRKYVTKAVSFEGSEFVKEPKLYVLGHVTGCVFADNEASVEGGAIGGYGAVVNYNIFEGNDAPLGSAVYDASNRGHIEQLVSDYDYNFWGFVDLPKNLLVDYYGSFKPNNWVVVDISEPVEGGSVFGVNFVLNDCSELTNSMPDYDAVLTVNNKSKDIVISDNVYTDSVDSTGKYNVDVNSANEGNLLASATFNVKTLEMVVTTTVNGTTATITVKVAKDATGKVGFHLDNLLGIKYVDVVDGVAVCKYDKLAAGEHSVDVNYHGDDYVYQVSKATFTVSDVKMTADDVDKFYKGSQQYIVTLVDGTPLAGETVTITLNGKEYTRVTDENGQAKMNINLNPGIYTVTATYNGETITNTIVVKSTVIGKDLTKMYCNDSQYYATFLDSEGKVLVNTAVWFNINGVIYNRVTDEHGIAGLNINLIPNEYIITAYNSATGQLFSNLIKVLPPLVQVKTVDNLVALQVLDKTGQPVKAGEDVLLNFKGKLLSATSDANGMVFFTDPSFDGTFATAYYDGCLVNVNLSSAKINTDEKEAIPW